MLFGFCSGSSATSMGNSLGKIREKSMVPTPSSIGRDSAIIVSLVTHFRVVLVYKYFICLIKLFNQLILFTLSSTC